MLSGFLFRDMQVMSAERDVEEALRKLESSKTRLALAVESDQKFCRHFTEIVSQENLFGQMRFEITLDCKRCGLQAVGIEKAPRCTKCATLMRLSSKNDWRAKRAELVRSHWVIVGSEPTAFRCTNARCRKLHVLKLSRELRDDERKLVAENGPIFKFPRGWPSKVKKGP